MINQMAGRFGGASLSMLSPGFLIDRLLDRIEQLSRTIVPAQADKLSREQTRSEARFDQFAA
jgi:hypothetical protein